MAKHRPPVPRGSEDSKSERLPLVVSRRFTGTGAVAALFALSAVPRAFAELVVGSQTPPTANTILRYDQTTGAPLGVFASGGEIDGPLGLTVGPDKNLYVASGNPVAPGQGEFGRILRYSGATGAFMGVFGAAG